jgi:hypothetical protein
VAVFRIALGLVQLINAWGLRRDLAYLYGPHGALGDAYRNGGFGLGRLSLVPLAIDRERWLRACWLVHVSAAAALTCGALTRPSAAVAFLTLTTLQSRNPLVTDGGDDVLRIMTFLTVFSQAGASLSVDYWWSHGGWVSQQPSNPWAWRLMQIQVSVVYAKSALAKLRGATWLDGRAVYLATEVEDFRRRRLPAWADVRARKGVQFR